MGIFWVASYPKSGNTWLRAFLANVMAPSRPVDLDAIADFCTSEASAHWAWPFVDARNERISASRGGMEVRQKVQQRIVDLNKGQHVFIKTHNRYGVYHGLPLVRPDLTVGAVYLLRDPRDVAVSLTHHWDLDIDAVIKNMGRSDLGLDAKKGEKSFEILGSWSEHVTSWTMPKPKNTLVLRYEDCVSDPMATFGRLARMLKLTDDENVIAEAVEATRFDRLKKEEKEKGFAERPPHAKTFFRSGKVGGWRDVLKSAEVKRIERDHAKVMRNFKYDLEFLER